MVELHAEISAGNTGPRVTRPKGVVCLSSGITGSEVGGAGDRAPVSDGRIQRGGENLYFIFKKQP
jgi:hypothetical protein